MWFRISLGRSIKDSFESMIVWRVRQKTLILVAGYDLPPPWLLEGLKTTERRDS